MENNTSGKKIGPIIGALIIVIILVIAALYAWGHRLNTSEQTPITSQESQEQSSSVAAASNSVPAVATPAKMSTSDDVDSLSKDLNTVDATSANAF